MSRIRAFTATSAFFVFGFAGVFAGMGTAHAEGDENACTTSPFKVKAVEKACAKGGRTEAKKMMKAVVKKAKEAGEDVNCKTCHKSLKTYETTPSAAADLKKWL